jgi:hypothetical protein
VRRAGAVVGGIGLVRHDHRERWLWYQMSAVPVIYERRERDELEEHDEPETREWTPVFVLLSILTAFLFFFLFPFYYAMEKVNMPKN